MSSILSNHSFDTVILVDSALIVVLFVGFWFHAPYIGRPYESNSEHLFQRAILPFLCSLTSFMALLLVINSTTYDSLLAGLHRYYNDSPIFGVCAAGVLAVHIATPFFMWVSMIQQDELRKKLKRAQRTPVTS